MKIDRTKFYAAVRKKPFKGILSASQKNGMDIILNVYEKNFVKQTSLPQFAYELGTTFHETGATMQPIKEKGGKNYFFRMYDPKGSRPKVAKVLGNIYPGDGVKFPGMGYVQNTGRSNARKATKRLKELGLIGPEIDLEKTPELQMRPDIAAAIMFIGMEEGWFTGRKLDQIIDNLVDGDEHSDFKRARSIINGTDRAEDIADYSDDFLAALVIATSGITEEAKMEIDSVLAVKNIVIPVEDIDDSDDSYDAPIIRSQKGKFAEQLLTKEEIKGIQVRFRNKGYFVKVDGNWGPEMKAAAIKLQATAGITEDGHYGAETRDALNDPSTDYKVSEARKNTTVQDLRAQGSKTIAATDGVKSTSKIAGLGLLTTGAGSAVVEYAPQAISWITPVREFFSDVPTFAWIILGLFVCFILWKNANKAEKARLDDEQTGRNVGGPDPSPSPPLTAVSSNEDSGDMPAFLRKKNKVEEEEKEHTEMVTR